MDMEKVVRCKLDKKKTNVNTPKGKRRKKTNKRNRKEGDKMIRIVGLLWTFLNEWY